MLLNILRFTIKLQMYFPAIQTPIKVKTQETHIKCPFYSVVIINLSVKNLLNAIIQNIFTALTSTFSSLVLHSPIPEFCIPLIKMAAQQLISVTQGNETALVCFFASV